MALLGNKTISADLRQMRQETPWRFVLDRDVDATGTSGTGRVAWGVMFPDGSCVLRWATEHTSMAVYDSLRDVRFIHGHDGATRVVWVDTPPFGPWDDAAGQRDRATAGDESEVATGLAAPSDPHQSGDKTSREGVSE